MVKKKIVILGGGYAGISAAKTFLKLIKKNDPIEVTLIEKNKYHTLMTQLHETACGRTKGRATQISYDEIFKKVKNIELNIVFDTIDEINNLEKMVVGKKGNYEFDYLIIGTGSRPEFFEVEGAEKYSFKLWSFKEAAVIYEQIQDCFIRASRKETQGERSKLLTFSVAGGGFTGVEMIGELASFSRRLCKRYGINRHEVNLYLIEAAPSILNVLSPKEVKIATKYLNKLGVNILCNSGIKKVEYEKIYLDSGREIDGTLIWSAGIKGNPSISGKDISKDNRQRIRTNEYLMSIDHENIYSIGDAISYVNEGRGLPQIVENALQSGELVANNIYADIKGKKKNAYSPKFHGSMISIGPFYGIAKVGKINLCWYFATLLKHLVNVHYHWEIGGLVLTVKYVNWQFISKVEPIIFSQEKGLDKQPTQFF